MLHERHSAGVLIRGKAVWYGVSAACHQSASPVAWLMLVNSQRGAPNHPLHVATINLCATMTRTPQNLKQHRKHNNIGLLALSRKPDNLSHHPSAPQQFNFAYMGIRICTLIPVSTDFHTQPAAAQLLSKRLPQPQNVRGEAGRQCLFCVRAGPCVQAGMVAFMTHVSQLAS